MTTGRRNGSLLRRTSNNLAITVSNGSNNSRNAKKAIICILCILAIVSLSVAVAAYIVSIVEERKRSTSDEAGHDLLSPSDHHATFYNRDSAVPIGVEVATNVGNDHYLGNRLGKNNQARRRDGFHTSDRDVKGKRRDNFHISNEISSNAKIERLVEHYFKKISQRHHSPVNQNEKMKKTHNNHSSLCSCNTPIITKLLDEIHNHSNLLEKAIVMMQTKMSNEISNTKADLESIRSHEEVIIVSNANHSTWMKEGTQNINRNPFGAMESADNDLTTEQQFTKVSSSQKHPVPPLTTWEDKQLRMEDSVSDGFDIDYFDRNRNTKFKTVFDSDGHKFIPKIPDLPPAIQDDREFPLRTMWSGNSPTLSTDHDKGKGNHHHSRTSRKWNSNSNIHRYKRSDEDLSTHNRQNIPHNGNRRSAPKKKHQDDLVLCRIGYLNV